MEKISIISTAILLMFIIDPFGNVPILLSILKDVDDERRIPIIAREVVIGLGILLVFLFFGKAFLNLFHLETEAVTIAGGVIFFVIGIRLIFPGDKGSNIYAGTGDPFIVPIALPMIAGPSALATLLVLSNQHQGKVWELFLSLIIAWSASAIILLSSPFLLKVLRKRGLIALERLMGMVLLMMSVQMFINGIRGLITM